MKKIYFRADASATIGYGHFIRTLALADMLKDDFDCTFFTCHPTSYQVSEMEKVCPFIPLQEETHSADFLSHLQGDEIVVLDNYFFTTDYQLAIKQKGCRLVCIDDMHDKHYVADVVINHGLTDESLFDVEPYTKLCLGFDWALLRHPFIEAVKKQRCHTIGGIEKVTITFGGCDDFDATGYYASNLLESKNIKSITAVVGDAYKPIHPISQDRRLTYCSGLSAEQMADLFRQSDLVICSASTVCIEALFCNTKVAAGWFVDNQMDFYNLVTAKGWVIGLGNVEHPYIDMDALNASTVPCASIGKDIRQNYCQLFHNLQDGYYLRNVRFQDLDLLFHWANDSTVRNNAFNTDPIEYGGHCQWFANCMQRDDVQIFILVKNSALVGQVRFNIEEGKAEIDYSISSESRGKGLGNVIIRLGIEEANRMGIKELIAKVKDKNIPSQRVFLNNGFMCNEDILTFEGVKSYNYLMREPY